MFIFSQIWKKTMKIRFFYEDMDFIDYKSRSTYRYQTIWRSFNDLLGLIDYWGKFIDCDWFNYGSNAGFVISD